VPRVHSLVQLIPKLARASARAFSKRKRARCEPGFNKTNTFFVYRGDDDDDEGGWYFYHPDHLGSTSYITDASGEVNQHIEYFAFGETFVEEGNDDGPFGDEGGPRYLFNAKELDEETGLYYYGARYYDPRTSVFLSIDPDAEEYPFMSAYCYAANNPIKFVDVNGEGPGDKVLGAAAAILDNATGGWFNLRGAAAGYVSEGGASDFNTGQDIGDVASIAMGAMAMGTGAGMIEGGSGAVAVGLAAELPSGGTSTVVVAAGGVAVGTGIALVAEGAILSTSGAASLASQKGRLNVEGDRRKNRLPDKGVPNSVAKNKPGTTAKKYNKDGNVEKEFNKGHQGKKVPKNEQSDHIHDYKPNPRNPSGRGDRQPGRPPKKNELKKDFDL
jgi:RHS repeat-associated protein